MNKRYPAFFALSVLILTLVWQTPVAGGEQYASGQIRIKGSDTLAAVASEWGKAYTKDRDDLLIQVAGGGSGNGIAALINGHVEIASTSRKLRKREQRLIAKKFKEQPHAVTVGLDAVSILVHNDNPINGISIVQLADVYGKNGKVDNWADLGITVPGCESGEIIRAGRKNNSGTFAFFRQTIFGKRAHLTNKLVTFDRSIMLVEHVATNPCAIGYTGMAFINSSVKTLCVAQKSSNKDCVPPTAAFTLNQKYPLSRPLFMYTLGEPKVITGNFLAWVQGAAGQNILRKAGFVPASTK